MTGLTPRTAMPFRLRLPTLFDGLRAAAHLQRPAYWGSCPHCDQTTPWAVNALRGEYRCTSCGESPLTPPHDAP